uniref:Uncharacterized protein n=1 Tax=Candidatus Kentrum sp. LPFa TaxID=2126335 RepID=A0A450WC56_9GAMM|nr:MAG: hypothetical protein BECKLPF1236A_GA0070988_101106 [Candidatus Kentron sp. LPFa]VFK30379.1 MAG: hypothetical protein BECKLPF1236C_GA0070990_101096 [Candidatus Kentron sp. LPFa]
MVDARSDPPYGPESGLLFQGSRTRNSYKWIKFLELFRDRCIWIRFPSQRVKILDSSFVDSRRSYR